MLFAYNTHTPGGHMIEAAKAAQEVDRLKKYYPDRYAEPHLIAVYCDELLSIYGEHLTTELRVSARMLCWWDKDMSIEDYEELFLSNILNRAYRPFDESHKNFIKILKLIKANNPEWEKAFERRHEDWVKMLTSRKVPIYIPTQ